jgi:hypothetical protein
VTAAHPYAVRQVRSGRTGAMQYIVVKNPGGRRVTFPAHATRQAAQSDADRLNIGAMVKPEAVDPRPYEVRRDEAEAAYWAERRTMTADPVRGSVMGNISRGRTAIRRHCSRTIRVGGYGRVWSHADGEGISNCSA